ncbi:hypothetical protein [Chromobacterium piscinae]|uniref:hypothetical protein n=1 Tax=Chromobacterium piscinae TaxID=686831 RepID=UPI0032616CED
MLRRLHPLFGLADHRRPAAVIAPGCRLQRGGDVDAQLAQLDAGPLSRPGHGLMQHVRQYHVRLIEQLRQQELPPHWPAFADGVASCDSEAATGWRDNAPTSTAASRLPPWPPITAAGGE